MNEINNESKQEKKMKYLLIDGNNMAIRSAFAHQELRNSEGIPTSVHFGVLQSLIHLKEHYPTHQMLVVWDGKSKRRMTEAIKGVEDGIIRSGYKENRQKDEQPQPLLDFYKQAPYLKRGLATAAIPQIRLSDFEADDVIASYCKKLKGDNEIVVVTSDKDYYQILDSNVDMYDGMKQELISEESLNEKMKITPEQYVEVGALMGDTGDNIFGIPGWGETTALKAIQEHKKWKKVYEHYENSYGELRKKFSDITDEEEFKKLTSIKTQKGNQKYPEIKIGMPYSGLTLAVEEKKTKNIKKNILMALMFKERVKLAYSLKKMDDDIQDLPEIKPGTFSQEKLLEYLDYYDIESLIEAIDIFK